LLAGRSYFLKYIPVWALNSTVAANLAQVLALDSEGLLFGSAMLLPDKFIFSCGSGLNLCLTFFGLLFLSRSAGAHWASLFTIIPACFLFPSDMDAVMSHITCSIQYRSDLRVLVVRWPDDASLLQLQADFTAILAVAEQHATARWLLDVRRRDQISPELGRWTTTTFYPLAASRFAPEVLRISVLCSPARMAVYAADPVQMQYLTYGLAPERSYLMRLFGDEGTAMEWLYS